MEITRNCQPDFLTYRTIFFKKPPFWYIENSTEKFICFTLCMYQEIGMCYDPKSPQQWDLASRTDKSREKHALMITEELIEIGDIVLRLFSRNDIIDKEHTNSWSFFTPDFFILSQRSIFINFWYFVELFLQEFG